MNSSQDNGSPAIQASERCELEFSASLHNLQLNTEFAHYYHSWLVGFFSSWQHQKTSSQSFIILKEQVIPTTSKTPEPKSNKSVSLELETELVC